MKMRTITMNNGRTFVVSSCGDADGFLWITLEENMTMAEVAEVFGNAENTKKIHHEYGGNDKVDYEGFTNLIRVETWGKTTITLKKEG